MKHFYSDKEIVQALMSLCAEAGIREAVISPGSRNAPLIFSFTACEEITCYSIVDERSAAFFALGMAQQLGCPVVLVCTSGTAVLNYAPAIAEAYYQHIPLIVVTADRPQEWIDQADGQTIRQNNIYANYIKYSCTLPESIRNKKDKEELIEKVSEAFRSCIYDVPGPVHINVPMDEPLYGREKNPLEIGLPPIPKPEYNLKINDLNRWEEKWDKARSVMILLGSLAPDAVLNELLSVLAENYRVIVLTETTSNMHNPLFISCIDRVLASIPEEEENLFSPDILITFDGQVTSKMIKKLLRKNKPKEHWHISPKDQHPDTYRCLTESIRTLPENFFEALLSIVEPKDDRFFQAWQDQNKRAKERHTRFSENVKWSDFKAFSILTGQIPEGMMIQLANSTPIRYAQLFDTYKGNRFFANRGTSGIDGCTSTAVGASVITQKPTLLISGDLSFFYDSNALWNNYLRRDFKIIVVNNGGGGIFRYVSGSMEEEIMEDFFETRQEINCEPIARCFGLDYYFCDNAEGLINILPAFFNNHTTACILEIKTPRIENAEVLKMYFKELGRKTT